MKIVIIVSANAEWRVVKPLFPNAKFEQSPFGEFTNLTHDTWHPSTSLTVRAARNGGTPVRDGRAGLTLFHGGWGKISAAASAQYVIDRFQPDLLLNLGTCGGFEGRIERGTIILVEKTIVYDIVEQMTDPDQAVEDYSTELDLSWLPRIPPFPVLRGLLVSGDRDIVLDDIPMLVKKYEAVAADWESGAIAWVAKKNRTRTLILRGVSDLVSSEGGETYGNYELFIQRTSEIMKKLFEQLPKWIEAIEKVEQGYRGY